VKAGWAIGALVLTGAAPADVFRPDRDHLFRSCATMSAYDADKPFGSAVRRGRWAFGAKQQEGAAIVLDAWMLHGDRDPNHLAYVLATARRESAGTFFPIREVPKCGTDEGCRERAIGRLLKARAERRNEGRRKKGLAPLPVSPSYQACATTWTSTS